MRLAFALVLLAALVGSAAADMYLHCPAGANGRNRERNDNRNNGNRLFDSQNNGKGGVPWRGDPTANGMPDPITFYEGSLLKMDWTNQHGCGPNENVQCDLIVQIGWASKMVGLRDGYPTSNTIEESDNDNDGYLRRRFTGEAGQNQQGTNTIPENQHGDDQTKQDQFYFDGLYGGMEFGMHESHKYYQRCRRTTRNKGLYASDQTLNRNDARATRQNPNGNRRGLECPEERDYYPYWRPTPWQDIAVMTNKMEYCEYYKQNSQNVRAFGFCECPDGTESCRNDMDNNLWPITATACTQGGGVWNPGQSHGVDAPDCLLHPITRDNHLGNAINADENGTPTGGDDHPEAAGYMWKVSKLPNDPEVQERGWDDAVIRVRYNISTSDYPDTHRENGGNNGVGFDSSRNCPRITLVDKPGEAGEEITGGVADNPQCFDVLTDFSVPLYNRPYVAVFDDDDRLKLSLAINTNQYGRTFQDRTYVMRIAKRPSGVGGTIHNLVTRGRRGNIVQAYPAVEYDFCPPRLRVKQGEYIHIQFHCSMFNAAKNQNNGEGGQYTDKHNIVQMEGSGHNFPLHASRMNMFSNTDIARRWALLEQDPNTCEVYEEGDDDEQNSITNCGKLNRAPYRFPNDAATGLVRVDMAGGTYHYMSSRNNNFSNRSHKGMIFVTETGLTAAEIAGIAIGSIAAVALIVGGICFYGKRNPDSGPGVCFSSCADRCGGSAAPPPDMEYTRH